MSWRKFGVGLALVVLLVDLDETFCALSDKMGLLVVADRGNKISISKSVVGYRTLVDNNTVVDVREGRGEAGGRGGTNSVEGKFQ